MASESRGTPSPAEAHAALAHLSADDSAFAAQIPSPWWYSLTLSTVVAAITFSQALTAPSAISIVAVGVLILAMLPGLYAKRYGISISKPVGPRTRRLLFLGVAVLPLGMVANLIIRWRDWSLWWGILPAIFVFAFALLISRWYDRALRVEIAAQRR